MGNIDPSGLSGRIKRYLEQGALDLQAKIGSLSAEGTLEAKETFVDPNGNEYNGRVGMPPGAVVMWSGAVDGVPDGWTLCDGTNGAPDLTDRFVVGAADSYAIGDTGGADDVTLDESQIPSHLHADGTLSADSHDHGDGSLSASSHDHGSGSLTASEHSHDGVHDHTGSVRGGSHSTSDDLTTYTVIDGPSGTSTATASADITGSTSNSSPGVTGSTSNSSAGVSGSTSETGGDESHENRPPYYAMAYIMKIDESAA